MITRQKILFVDDNCFEMQGIIDYIEAEGFSVRYVSSVEDAKKSISSDPPDLAVLDIRMHPDPRDSEFETKGGFATGIVLAKWITNNHPNVRFAGLTAAFDVNIAEYFNTFGCGFLTKPVMPSQVARWIRRLLETETSRLHIRTFIVHGHDEQAMLDLKNYLQNTLKLSEPIILHEQPSLGRTIIEKFEEESEDVDLVFVLLTPDDKICDAYTPNVEKRRARQNVVFEMGYFLGKLSRHSGHVLLLHKGPLELPSDISGLIYIDISQGIEAAGELIRRELSGYL
ncbi:MAG: response regulator [Colwellia sp.]|nr:response regulator [Colwellia sp.]